MFSEKIILPCCNAKSEINDFNSYIKKTHHEINLMI